MADRESGTLDEIVFRGRTALDQREFEVLMEQYKLFVDTSERLVARRQVVNTSFLSVNTLALSAVGLVAKEVQTSPLVAIGVVAISVAAIVLCVAWKTLVRSYAQLNRGKFAVTALKTACPPLCSAPSVPRWTRERVPRVTSPSRTPRRSSPTSSWSSTGWQPS